MVLLITPPRIESMLTILRRSAHTLALLVLLIAFVAAVLIYKSTRLGESAVALEDYTKRAKEVCPLIDHPNERLVWRILISPSADVHKLLHVVREGPVGSSKTLHLHISWWGEPTVLDGSIAKAREWGRTQGNFETRFDCYVWGYSAQILDFNRNESIGMIKLLVLPSFLAIGLVYGIYGAIKFWLSRRSSEAQ
nr:putative integron gene cassette protein [uncultured bacterium]